MQAALDALETPLDEDRRGALAQHARALLSEAEAAGDDAAEDLRGCLDALEGAPELSLLHALVAAYVLNGGIILAQRPEPPATPPGADGLGGVPCNSDEAPEKMSEEELQNLMSELDKDFL